MYLAGHSDVLAGALISARADAAWAQIVELRHDEGPYLGPFKAYLLICCACRSAWSTRPICSTTWWPRWARRNRMAALDLRIATCVALPEPDVDQAPLAAALAAAGLSAALVGWDDPAADWDAPIPTLVRATWNYPVAPAAFLAWVDRASAAAPMLNPPDVVRGNLDKRYLLELAARGVPVVPTVLVERGQTCELAAIAAPSVVIKPAIGAASMATRRFAPGDPAALAHLAAITAERAALVQPYVASVEGPGERALVWIDGELSHAVRKRPRFTGDAEQVDGPVAIADDERAVAEAALAPVAGRILYGRVDVARDTAGQPMVMELELIEPSLYLTRCPRALDRFVAAIRRALAVQPPGAMR